MSIKKFFLPVALAGTLFIAGCSDDEVKEVDTEKEETPEEVVKPEETDVPEIVLDENVEPVETNSEMNAFLAIQTYFDGINEKDVEKMKSVNSDETAIAGMEPLFEALNIKTKVESFEVISQQGTTWKFSVDVLFEDVDNTGDFFNNISTYEIDVDTATEQITYMEVIQTKDL